MSLCSLQLIYNRQGMEAARVPVGGRADKKDVAQWNVTQPQKGTKARICTNVEGPRGR